MNDFSQVFLFLGSQLMAWKLNSLMWRYAGGIMWYWLVHNVMSRRLTFLLFRRTKSQVVKVTVPRKGGNNLNQKIKPADTATPLNPASWLVADVPRLFCMLARRALSSGGCVFVGVVLAIDQLLWDQHHAKNHTKPLPNHFSEWLGGVGRGKLHPFGPKVALILDVLKSYTWSTRTVTGCPGNTQKRPLGEFFHE